MQSEEQRGDAAYQQRESAKRRRQWTIQFVVLAVLVAFVWLLVQNVSSNLAERSIRSGFDFLKGAANFEIGEVLLPFDSSQPVWLAFLNGVLNTIRVAVFAIITSMVLGAVVGIMRLSNHPILRFLGTAHVEVYRNIPLIIQLFAVYMLITELLPASTEPLHAGSWALLSKAGLQFAVPVQTGLAAMAAFIAGVLTALLVRETQRRRVTDLVAGLLGFVAGITVALAVWVIFGFYVGSNCRNRSRRCARRQAGAVECGSGTRPDSLSGGELHRVSAVDASGDSAAHQSVHEPHEELVSGRGDRLPRHRGRG